ncbi:penicillin-binding protein activator LpoB, partial [bacterium]|nr:penicillin-binding protein activator LpoB [bacterium]
DGDEVKYYQVDVYLVDLEDNSKVWVGDKKIKKYVSRSGYRP